MFFDTLSISATIICLILAVFVTAAYAARIWYRKDVRYDVYSEWLGHGLHGIGMMYMSVVMLGWMYPIVPYVCFAVLFAFCTAVFIARLLFRIYYIWWWDVLHVVGSASMTYMFLDMSIWSTIWTLVFIVYYLVVMAIYVYYIREHLAVIVFRARRAHLLSDYSHEAMAVAMILMLSIMQWPEMTARLSGIVCGDERGHVTSPHNHQEH